VRLWKFIFSEIARRSLQEEAGIIVGVGRLLPILEEGSRFPVSTPGSALIQSRLAENFSGSVFAHILI